MLVGPVGTSPRQFAMMALEMETKRLELLRELRGPLRSSLAILVNPSNASRRRARKEKRNGRHASSAGKIVSESGNQEIERGL